MSSVRVIIILTLSVILFMECKSDVSSAEPVAPLDHQLLDGRWDLVEAKRNGKVTTTLVDTYFEFYGQDSMRSNLQESSIQQIILRDTLFWPIDSSRLYIIEHLSPDTLDLSFTIARWDFQLRLSKAL